jgi:hypothetical protein
MARDRRSKDLEDLRGENRQLQKLVKHLKKQLARSEKTTKKYEHLDAEPELGIQEPVSQILPKNCDKCGAATKEIELGKMGKMLVCTKDNTHRKRLK